MERALMQRALMVTDIMGDLQSLSKSVLWIPDAYHFNVFIKYVGGSSESYSVYHKIQYMTWWDVTIYDIANIICKNARRIESVDIKNKTYSIADYKMSLNNHILKNILVPVYKIAREYDIGGDLITRAICECALADMAVDINEPMIYDIYMLDEDGGLIIQQLSFAS